MRPFATWCEHARTLPGSTPRATSAEQVPAAAWQAAARRRVLPTRCARPGLDPASMHKNLFLIGENGRLASLHHRAASLWSAPNLQLESARLMRATAPVTGRRRTKRRTLQRSMWYGFPAQSAFLVRGSSRRIMTGRFRPADIRVINRRIGLLSCHPLCRLSRLKPSST
jgi:hypothetical protein